MARGDPAGGRRFPAEEEECSWVPVRIARLTNLSRDLGVALQSRWWDHHEERRWVKKASAAAAAMDPDADRQLALARELCDVMSISWCGFSCTLRGMAEDLDDAVDPARRPRPASAAWWSYWYQDHGGCVGGRHGFVHLSRGQVARARGLLADARARARRIKAQEVEELKRRCWPAPAAVESTAALMGRQLRAQRLADAVLGPLQELKRLVDHLLVLANAGTDARGRTRRARRRSAPPPPSRAAQHQQEQEQAEDQCMLRRSASAPFVADE
nr:unnamed protein product [Digitaria exilis]